MLYSDDKKFFFIHNPKVAGTSVRKALEEYDSSGGYYWNPEYIKVLNRLTDKAHIPASELFYHRLGDKAPDYFTFGFVRNPYERFISAWEEYKIQHNYSECIDINEWAHVNINETSVRYKFELIHFCPQYYFFYNGDKLIADYVGRQENIEYDWYVIQSILGISADLKQYNIKKNLPGRVKVKDLNDETISLINKVYRKDFLFFKYPMINPTYEKDFGEDVYLEYFSDLYIPEMKLVKDLQNEVYHLAEEIKQKNSVIDNLNVSLSNANEEINRCADFSSKDEHYIKELELEISRLKQQCSSLEESYEKMLNSKSFRYTKVLRRLSAFLRH